MAKKITDLVKIIIKQCQNVKIAVDMTAGNGYDSLFILDTLKPSCLFAFDIQSKAQISTKSLIGHRNNFLFILDSHENIDKYIKEKIDLAIYNLGYLPGANKKITTMTDSTIISLGKVLDLLNVGGRVIITVYPGHKEGKKESEKLKEYLSKLDCKKYSILRINYENRPHNPPYILVIEREKFFI